MPKLIAQGRIGYDFNSARKAKAEGRWALLARAALRNRRDIAGGVVAVGAILAIMVNSLFMQAGPHPAPIFAIRPLPIATREATGAITQFPRPRPASTEIQKPELVSVPLPRPRAPQAVMADLRNDPIADLINAGRQLTSVQRALNEFGYGPIKVSGTLDDKTRLAIEQFERDHNLSVTGQLTPRFRRELASATGRPLD